MANKNDRSPISIDLPKVGIGGINYTLRFNNAALYELDELGLSMADVQAQYRTGKLKVSTIFKLLKACITEPNDLTPKQIAELCPNPDDLKPIVTAINLAMEKAPRPASVPLRETAATESRGETSLN